ncbi:MAG: peptidoglycan-binding protein [Hyphomicrobiales bacterium]
MAGALALTIAVPAGGHAAETPQETATETTGTVDASQRPEVDLALQQRRQSDCIQGSDCEYRITIANMGTVAYAGAINVLGTANFELADSERADADVTCTGDGNALTCRTTAPSLPPGKAVEFSIMLRVPQSINGSVRSCAVLAFPGAEFEDPHRDLVAIVQLALKLKGFYADGPVDGDLGPGTRKAIEALREREALPEGGIDGALITALFGPLGLMHNDANLDNNHACDEVELPEVKVAKRSNRRRTARQPSLSGFASATHGTGRRNGHKMEGLD